MILKKNVMRSFKSKKFAFLSIFRYHSFPFWLFRTGKNFQQEIWKWKNIHKYRGTNVS